MLPDQYTHQALEDVLTYNALSRPGHLQREVLVLGVDVGPEQLHPSLEQRQVCKKNPIFVAFSASLSNKKKPKY
jgi:hypothetical protein